MTFTELEKRVQLAKSLDFGDIFNNCITLFKKVWVQGLVMLLLTGLILVPLYLVIYVPFIALGFLDITNNELSNDVGVAVAVVPVLGLG